MLKGCKNRPFFDIVVARNRRMKKRDYAFVEQLGFYDPLQNSLGSKVVGLDVRRIRHWLGVGVELTPGVAHLLGLSGIAPVYPPSLTLAKKRREKRAELEKKLQEREMKEKAEKEKVMKEEEKVDSEVQPETQDSDPDSIL